MPGDTFSLSGKIALVTGSGRENGIGAAIAKNFARNGAAVAIHHVSEGSKSRAEKVAESLAREFGVKTTVVRGSVETLDGAKSLIQQVLKGLGTDHIDILVNNGGYAAGKQDLLEATPESLQQEFGVNVFGPIYMAQSIVSVGKMPRGGRIINIGTIASKLVPRTTSLYSTTKSAQDTVTVALAGELGQTHGITVNTIAPGGVPTDMSTPYLKLPDGSDNPAMLAMQAMTRAEKRYGTAEDIADAALLLVQEKSRWITAQWISVSGGVI
ncbi:putative short-chain dehydrogenase [Hypoxylon sp. NC1633]|nr:putative short-chain dehydrogenase [Hypoxylon sp. NC1633]